MLKDKDKDKEGGGLLSGFHDICIYISCKKEKKCSFHLVKNSLTILGNTNSNMQGFAT